MIITFVWLRSTADQNVQGTVGIVLFPPYCLSNETYKGPKGYWGHNAGEALRWTSVPSKDEEWYYEVHCAVEMGVGFGLVGLLWRLCDFTFENKWIEFRDTTQYKRFGVLQTEKYNRKLRGENWHFFEIQISVRICTHGLIVVVSHSRRNRSTYSQQRLLNRPSR